MIVFYAFFRLIVSSF